MNDLQMTTTTGTDQIISKLVIEEFDRKLRGRLLCADDPEYDGARRVWNGMVDKHPALIARCHDAHDAAACVLFAREHGVLLSVRGGGHNYAGKAVCNGGLVADLSLMKDIYVDPASQTARAQPGVRLGEFDRATQEHGLATTLGVNTDTGIAGLTLGGGYGWLAGKYGLACDSLLSAEVVTADGKTVHCSEEQHEDLFWGLRGAGANFGIVTEFKYRLHSVGPVLGGVILQPLNGDVLRLFDELSYTAPDELTTMGAVQTGPEGLAAFAIVGCYSGELQEGEQVLKHLRAFAKPVFDSVTVRPYLEMQSLLDASWPAGRQYYNKAHNIRRISDGAIETVLEYSAKLPTPLTSIAFQQLHGAAGRIAVSATAFPHRYDHFDLLVHPATDNPLDSPKMIAWARGCWTALKPFVEPAVYVNALEDGDEEGERRVREAYGPNYNRLSALKAKYDPDNIFRQNSNIKPAGKSMVAPAC